MHHAHTVGEWLIIQPSAKQRDDRTQKIAAAGQGSPAFSLAHDTVLHLGRLSTRPLVVSPTGRTHQLAYHHGGTNNPRPGANEASEHQ